jgi:hypothetical protein
MITWNIVSVDTATVNNNPNTIVMVRWVCKASSGDKATVELGATALGAPGKTFIDFADLSEADVMGFCVANGLDKAAAEAKAEAQLQSALSAPVPVTTLDWDRVA